MTDLFGRAAAGRTSAAGSATGSAPLFTRPARSSSAT